jgi:hypothetical protein
MRPCPVDERGRNMIGASAGRESAEPPRPIGGVVCAQPLRPALLPADPRHPTESEVEGLWRAFVAIGEAWQNTTHESAGLRSSWLDFLIQKCTTRPSYIGEYVSALEVFDELVAIHTEAQAFPVLFFESGVDTMAPPLTRLAHAKQYVINEFIRVQIVIGGFKNFITPDPTELRPDEIVNHRGFIAGSRYNRVKPVRVYMGPASTQQVTTQQVTGHAP